jgi:hypothetical protein
METNEGLEYLTKMFQDRDWFSETGMDNIGRYVVYTKYVNLEVLTTIPEMLNNKQVLVHFIGSKTSRSENFIHNSNYVPFSKQDVIPVVDPVVSVPLPKLELVDVSDEIEELSSDLLEDDLEDLLLELESLEKVYGSNTVEAIFYEEHDGKNCVTYLSNKFPALRQAIHTVYEKYGFDLIYDNI